MAAKNRGQHDIDFRRSAAPEAERANPNHRTLQAKQLATLLGSETACFGGPFDSDSFETPSGPSKASGDDRSITKSPTKVHDPYTGTSESGA
jgi:hypothetical protein